MSGEGAAALVLAAILAGSPGEARAAQPGVFLEVNPNTVQAGFQVGIHASCGDDLNPATVTSRAFGDLTLTPQQGSPLLTGSATVPHSTQAGEYQVELHCVDGGTASAELFVLDMARPTRGPDTGGGGTAGSLAAAAPALVAGGSLAALGAGAWLLIGRRRPG